MCCGQKRSAIKVNAGSPNSALNLLYSGQIPMRVRGTATGSVYQFSPVQPVQAVDPRDAQVLLASRLFRLSR